MSLSSRVPPPRLLARAAGIVLVGAVSIGLVWWLIEGKAAKAVYLSITFMVLAVTHLPISRQLVVGLAAGVATAVGAAVAGNTLLLILAAVVACLAQQIFNRWSVRAAAMLPANLILEAVVAPGHPLRIALATWLGATTAIGLAALVRVRAPARPASAAEAAGHAVALAAGVWP
jgi:hypothetical protein